MTYIVLTIIFTTVLVLLFKAFQRWKVNTFHAIVVNYLVCVLTGIIFYPQFSVLKNFIVTSAFPYAVSLGVLFITIFFLLSLSAQQISVAAASVANKLSLIIPVAFGIVLYEETLDLRKTAAILLALLAVYLFSLSKSEKAEKVHLLGSRAFLLLLTVFLGSGIIDTTLKYVQHYYLDREEYAVFPIFVFMIAFVAGIIGMGYQLVFRRTRLELKSILGGIALGVPNYFSLYFLLCALSMQDWESSEIFPVINIGIVSLSAISAFFLFKEKLFWINFVGLTAAIGAIVLIASP